MNAYTTQIRAALWWLAPVILLGLAVAWETDWGDAVRKPAPSATPIAPTPVDTTLLPEYVIAGGVAAHSETVQRTLFNPTRRPAPVSPQDGANARLQRGQFALAGTTIAEGKNTALLREIAGNKTRRVQQGDFINGMLVAQVVPDRVRLAVDDEWEDVVLKVATNPRPTTVAVPAAAPAPVAAPAGAAPPVAAQRPPQATPSAQREAAAQTLAERRRAARAAQAARAGNTTAQPGSAGNSPGAPAAATNGTAGADASQNRTFDDLNRTYQQRNPRTTPK